MGPLSSSPAGHASAIAVIDCARPAPTPDVIRAQEDQGPTRINVVLDWCESWTPPRNQRPAIAEVSPTVVRGMPFLDGNEDPRTSGSHLSAGFELGRVF